MVLPLTCALSCGSQPSVDETSRQGDNAGNIQQDEGIARHVIFCLARVVPSGKKEKNGIKNRKKYK